jgi:dihydroorotate dehydrogenase
MTNIIDTIKPFYPLAFKAIRGNLEGTQKQLLNTLQKIDRSRGEFWGQWLISQLSESLSFSDSRLSQSLWGLNFPNPVGLAAGFDKDGLGAGLWHNFGFGFAEVGAVTLEGQPGNPKPRLFRLPEDLAGLNRMGANNLGAPVLAATLQQSWQRQPRQIPIGINLCKSKNTPLEKAPEDYLGSFRYLFPHADYFVVNVSSPNTPGLRSLQSGEQLDKILDILQTENQGRKPLLVKISPDLEWEDIITIIDLAFSYQLAGIVATNTTTKRTGLKTTILPETGKPITEEAGGISGQPLRERSTEVIGFIYQQTQGNLPIIGVGGIFSLDDAWEKITAGASLLQIYTGWLYRGPWLVSNILQGLTEKLEANGLTNINQAVGINNGSLPKIKNIPLGKESQARIQESE